MQTSNSTEQHLKKRYHDCGSLLYGVVAFREQRSIPNVVFCAERFGRTHTLYFKVIRLPHVKRCRLFSERVGPRIISIS